MECSIAKNRFVTVVVSVAVVAFLIVNTIQAFTLNGGWYQILTLSADCCEKGYLYFLDKDSQVFPAVIAEDNVIDGVVSSYDSIYCGLKSDYFGGRMIKMESLVLYTGPKETCELVYQKGDVIVIRYENQVRRMTKYTYYYTWKEFFHTNPPLNLD